MAAKKGSLATLNQIDLNPTTERCILSIHAEGESRRLFIKATLMISMRWIWKQLNLNPKAMRIQEQQSRAEVYGMKGRGEP